MNKADTIVIASDHAGFRLKEFIKAELDKMSISVDDVGAYNAERSDYPLYISRAASKVSNGTYRRGIAICGSGIGASIVANRFKKVRAALCVTPEMAILSRQHNDANMLVLGERIITEKTAADILVQWLNTPFSGGRHQARIEMIDAVE